MGGGIVLLVIAIVVISAVVGAIAQFLNKMNEASTPPPRRSKREESEGRKTDKDMDRFLAEIDRLRRKNAEGSEPTAAKPTPPPAPKPKPPKPVPIAKQGRGEKKPKLMAEVVEPQKRRRVDTSAMLAPPAPVAPGTLSPDSRTKPEDLPVATVVGATSSTGAPSATRVTRLATRARPTPKTNLAMNLTELLNSGQGVAMAIILSEILGPPKSQKPHRSQSTDEPIA